MKVALYARVSTDEQEMELQIEELRDYCRKNNYDYDLYIDNGETGTNFANRKEFIKLMTECGLEYSKEYNAFKIDKFKEKKYDKIICKGSSRFGRMTETLPLLELLKKNNVIVVFLESNQSNENILNPTDNLIMGLSSLLNKNFSLETSLKVKRAMTQSAKRGDILVNPSIFGYDYKDGYLYKNSQSKYVELIFVLYSQGIGLRRIAKILNNKGIKTSKGNDWVSEGIRTIINNPKYYGANIRNIYSISKITKDTHVTKNSKDDWIIHENSQYIEPIISKDLYNKCQEIKESKVCSRRGKFRGINPLVGKIKCAECGENYIKDSYNTKDGKEIYYKCSSKKYYGIKKCNNPNIKEEDIKNIITNDYIGSCIFRYRSIILNSLKSSKKELMVNYSKEHEKSLIDEINSVEEQINKLLDLYMNSLIEKDDYKVKYNYLSQKKEHLKSKVNNSYEEQLNIINKKIENIKNISIKYNYSWPEILNTIEEIRVNNNRSISITLNINGIIFHDDISYSF